MVKVQRNSLMATTKASDNNDCADNSSDSINVINEEKKNLNKKNYKNKMQSEKIMKKLKGNEIATHNNISSDKEAKALIEGKHLPEQEEEQQESMVADISVKRTATAHTMTNRQKCLVLGARNMSSKDRHLLLDLRNLMPHAREHAKLGRTHHIAEDLIELCQLHQCNTLLFVEPHRHDVTYMWFAQAPAGPSLKVQIANIHTADEIRMAGNCLKFSRPLLHFDREFELRPHLRVAKTLLHMIFNTPRYHPKSKPFVDRIMSFFWLDQHIWVRNYQIVPTSPPSLLEIGPRFTLEPVAIFNGCCRGNVLWRNENALPPTEQRRSRKMRKLEKMQSNEEVKALSERHRALHPTPASDPLDLIFKS